MKFTKIALTSAILLTTGSAISAPVTNGNVGATSSDAQSTVSINVGDAVRVSDINNFTFSNSASSTTVSDTICVYHRGAATYGIKFESGRTGASAFEMVDGSNSIAYTVKYEGNTTGNVSSATAAVHGTKMSASGANQTSVNCGGTNNGTIYLTTDATSLQAAPQGNYSDTLVVTVTPN